MIRSMKNHLCTSFGCSVAVIGIAPITPALAQTLSTVESSRYLLIGTGPENLFQGRQGVGPAVTISGYEVGANRAPIPSSGDFLSGGSSGGPSLLFNVPSIPLAALPVTGGTCGNGNIAITNGAGVFILSETGVYGNLGIRTAQPAQAADIGTGNSFYNDSNGFPNTFTSTGPTDPGVNNNIGGFGTFVPAANANPLAAIEQPTAAGVFGTTNFAALEAELDAARAAILSYPATQVLNVPSGVLNIDTTVLLAPGRNVIDIVTSANDFQLDSMTFLVNGPAGSYAIFRVPADIKMTVSNSNLLVGTGGIDTSSVLFFSNRPDNSSHFEISNSIVNGFAFWSLGEEGASINVSEAQGCAQFVADKITLSGSRLCGCQFDPSVAPPAPCPADLNGDRVIGLSDLAILLSNFGLSGNATAAQGDLNGDRAVNLTDLAQLLSVFGTNCP